MTETGPTASAQGSDVGSDPRREPRVDGRSDRRVAVLGRGAFGEVALLVRREGRFEGLFAQKRLLPVHQEDHELRSMFFEEARLAGMIRHPNVVSVLDVGEDEQGPFLLMDYVEGVSAHRLIEASLAAQRELPLQVGLRIVAQVAEGLHAAHQLTDREGRPLGLVHRDVSPANVLVGYDGVARVTDFGVARALGRTTQTSTGFLKGKLGYMSPEQLRFEEPDRRSDLFALGVVLFELVALRRLYANRDGMDGARRILQEPPPDLADHRDDVPDALVQLLFSLLAKAPEHRPRDAKTVAARLEEIGAALAVEEGRVDVAEHLAELFAGERERARSALAVEMARGPADATAAIAARPQPGRGARTELPPVASPTTAVSPPLTELPVSVLPGPVRPRRLGVAAALAAGLAATVALAVAARTQLATPEPATAAGSKRSVITLAEPAVPSAAPLEAAGVRAAARDEPPARPVAPSGSLAPAPAAAGPDLIRAPAPAATPAAPRKRPRKPKPSPAPGVPMWGW